MGLCIEYVVRVKHPTASQELIDHARAAARRLKWKIRRASKGSLAVAFSPHPRCEDVVLDFADGTVCEDIVKTSGAPPSVHVEIVKFFDELKPLAKSIRLEDDTGYAKHRDLRKLNHAFDEFDEAMAVYSNNPRKQSKGIRTKQAKAKQAQSSKKPITIVLGALTITADGRVEKGPSQRVLLQSVKRPGKGHS